MRGLALMLVCTLVPAGAAAQSQAAPSGALPAPTPASPPWSVTVEGYLYLQADDPLIMPVISVDRGSLHLEGRYQYEDRETASIWAGWRFERGTTVQLEVVPMAGVVVGRTTGVAPGLGFTLSWRNLELYSENEYVFDLEDSDGSFGYTWSELGWQASPTFRVGLAAQRTAEHRGARWIDSGAFAAVSKGPAEVSFYWFNLEPGTRFAIVALAVTF